MSESCEMSRVRWVAQVSSAMPHRWEDHSVRRGSLPSRRLPSQPQALTPVCGWCCNRWGGVCLHCCVLCVWCHWPSRWSCGETEARPYMTELGFDPRALEPSVLAGMPFSAFCQPALRGWPWHVRNTFPQFKALSSISAPSFQPPPWGVRVEFPSQRAVWTRSCPRTLCGFRWNRKSVLGQTFKPIPSMVWLRLTFPDLTSGAASRGLRDPALLN